jgi:hypothetical protein
MGKMRNSYRILVRKSERKKALGCLRRRWKYNIKTKFDDINCEGVDWLQFSRNSEHGPAVMNTATSFRVS